MCGIAGLFTPANARPLALDVALASALLAHRGPDASGEWRSPDGRYVALFRRLAIIDLMTGDQPIIDEINRRVLIGNGEIYNYLELRDQFSSYRFRTMGDMETVLALAATRGDDFTEPLNGMYALALYDERQHRLVLVRDRLGIKPLYWARLADGSVIYASEIKPILASGLVAPALDQEAVEDYLAYGYVPAPRTLFQGIQKLPPAHRLTIEADGRMNLSRYWFPKPQRSAGGVSEIVAELTALFRDSVRLQLRSDVDFAALLSGGIDSGLMVAMAAQQMSRPLKTFTVRFTDGVDETPLARLVARRYATDHKEIDIAAEDIDAHFLRLIWSMEEPLADASVLPNFLIEQALAREVRVALNGTGGDELFAGYPRYFQRHDEQMYLRLPRALRHSLVNPLVGIFDDQMAWRLARAEKFATDRGRYLHEHSAWFPIPLLRRIGHDGHIGESLQERAFDSYAKMHPSDPDAAALYADLAGYLPEDLLLLLDRTSMTSSVEGRVPYLDHRFVEMALGLPAAIRTPNGRQKGLQRDIARSFLPREVVDAPKRGFASPIMRWASGSFGVALEKMLTSPKALARGWWTAEGIRYLRRSPVRYAHRLYALAVLEITVRLLIESPISLSAPTLGFHDFVASGGDLS